MYNRYIPQPDGSFRRNRMEDRPRPPEKPQKEPCPPPQEPCSQEPRPKPPCAQMRQPRPYRPPQKRQESEAIGIGNFLRQLLPRDFDTADLIVVLLLLLMSADGSDDNSALLTLALYLFL